MACIQMKQGVYANDARNIQYFFMYVGGLTNVEKKLACTAQRFFGDKFLFFTYSLRFTPIILSALM